MSFISVTISNWSTVSFSLFIIFNYGKKLGKLNFYAIVIRTIELRQYASSI